MTILKDAASTAIYGSQGANGVIVVTTKSGRAEKMTIEASVKLGISSLNNGNLEVMNGAELYDYYTSFQNANEISFPRWNKDLRDSNFSWWDLATQNGLTQEYNVSLRGGNEKMQSYLSVGYYDEEGAVKGYDYSRYNFRLKTTYKPFDWWQSNPRSAVHFGILMTANTLSQLCILCSHGIVPMTKTATWFLTATVVG